LFSILNKKFENNTNKVESTPSTSMSSISMDAARKVNLSHMGLKELPPLPKGIVTLDCSHNQLTSLPPLPSTMRMLVCNDNQLTTLPTLPLSLERVICANNQLTILPPFPRSLRELNCSNNRLMALHPLPMTILSLVCKSNNIQFLPALPPFLMELRCENNPLEDFPELPSYLSILTYKLPIDNHITEFIHLLPEITMGINVALRDWAGFMAIESRKRCNARCIACKEEIMMKAWHPSRMLKLLELEYDVEDM